MRLNIVLSVELEAVVLDEGAADSRTEPGWEPEFEIHFLGGSPYEAEPVLKEIGLLEEARGLAADALHEKLMERRYGNSEI